MARILILALLLAVSLSGCDRGDPIVVIQLNPKNPDIIYVATNDYIYKTRDGGQTWTNLSTWDEPFAGDFNGGRSGLPGDGLCGYEG